MRSWALCLAVGALAWSGLPASLTGARAVGITSPLPGASYLRDAARAGVLAAHAGASEVRAAAKSGRFLAVVQALSAQAGAADLDAPSLPAPSPRLLAALASLPVDVRAAVGGLAAAVQRAASMVGTVPKRDFVRALRATARNLTARAGAPRNSSPRSIALPDSIARAEARDPAALSLIAAALDAYAPVLAAWSASGGSDATGAGCDVVDQAPVLCIGSEGANTYTNDYLLTIDRGGNDTYRNGAGLGAAYDSTSNSSLVPVSIVLDQSGDDTYVAPSLGDKLAIVGATVIAGQGAGMYGGIGILVDAGGNDTYSAESPAPGENHYSAVLAQGMGWAGDGFLFDDSGTDRYSILGSTSADNSVIVAGQATAGTMFECGAIGGCPVAGLIDRGIGSDSYSIDSGTVTQTNTTGPPPATIPNYARIALGQASAWGTAAVLYDEGGPDAFTIDASGRFAVADGYVDRSLAPLVGAYGQAQAEDLGKGFLLEGAGSTTYSLTATVDGLANFLWAVGQAGTEAGINAQVATAVLDDGGGDDTYTLGANASYDVTRVVDDGCGCSSASARIDALGIPALPGWVIGQGGNRQNDNLAILHDAAGNDTYRANATEHLGAVLEDRLSAPSQPATLDVVGFGSAIMYVQGAGLGNTGAGQALLEDDAGTDHYVARSDDDVTGSATSADPSMTPSVLAVAPGVFETVAQGAGRRGTLLDLAGSGDRLLAAATRSASTSPNPDGALEWGYALPSFQGADRGQIVVLGTNPLLVSNPSAPTCIGARGFDSPWSGGGCQPGTPRADVQWDGSDGAASYGYAPEASGTVTSLAVADPGSVAADRGDSSPYDGWNALPANRDFPRVEVSATLMDASGKPVAGQVIHFNLQTGNADLTGAAGAWFSLWQAEGITDDQGIATASLPLWGTDTSEWRPGTAMLWRIAATSDGQVGLQPAHGVRSLSMS